MVSHKFLIHRVGDTVGVAVADIDAGEEITGIYMDDDSAVRVMARNAIPLSHKIAVAPVGAGAQVIEYGVPIGIAPDGLSEGEYVHTHNLKSARW